MGFLGKENVHRIDAFATQISKKVWDVFFWYQTEKRQPKAKHGKAESKERIPKNKNLKWGFQNIYYYGKVVET